MYLAENLTTLKRDATGQLALERELPNVLSKPGVSFHLLPLAVHSSCAAAPSNPATVPSNKRSVKICSQLPRRSLRRTKAKDVAKERKRGVGPMSRAT